MILKSLSLTNFGIYKGFNHLCLDTSVKSNSYSNKPIILIGGQNGAGKSTIFEAIKLSLYGFKSISDRSSNADYQKYLASRKNWGATSDEESAVELKFSTFRNNTDPALARDYDYRIRRSWTVNNDKVSEKFELFEDDQMLELDQSFWQDFIDEIIPQGVVDLFFFDGEKIQDLAEGGSSSLKEAIKALLNLSIIPSLSNDLDMILKKQAISQKGGESAKKLKDLNSMKLNVDSELKILRDLFASKDGKVNAIKSSIKRLEQKIKDVGGEFYSERDRLNSEKAKEETQKANISENITKVLIEIGPFMLSGGLLQKVHNSLEKDIQISEKAVLKEVLTQKKKELDKAILGFLKTIKLDKEDKSILASKISGFTDAWTTDVDSEPKFNLSVNELRRAIEVLDEIPKTKSNLKEMFQSLEQHERRIKKLRESLDRAFDDDKVKDLHKQLNEENIKLGQYQKDVSDIDEKMNSLLRDSKEIDKKIEKLYGELEKSEDHTVNFSRVGNVLSILKEFEKELTKNKIEHLEEEILDCYKRIHRKEGFIQRFSIDPDSFSVYMYDSNNKQVPVNKLSAGERQIYAICVLWALSRMSGMTLPMVIDTPLGRLDSAHRDNLVRNFFPNASHQVVILSTDTEIDNNYFDLMNNNICKTYNIDFDLKLSTTKVNDGYFKKNIEASV